MKIYGKGGMDRRKEQKVLEPGVFDRRKPLAEEIARMRTLKEVDRFKWCDDFVRKMAEPGYVKWLRDGVVYKVLKQ
jgi:hypothetical protein